MNKQEYEQSIKEKEKAIECLEEEIDDVSVKIDTLENDKDAMEREIADIESQIEALTTAYMLSMNGEELRRYHVDRIVESDNERIQGQFKIGEQYAITNGYIMILSNAEYDGVKYTEGVSPETIEALEKGLERIEFKTAQIPGLVIIDQYQNKVNISDKIMVNKGYLEMAVSILGLSDGADYYASNKVLAIKQGTERAYILGIKQR